MLPMMRGFWTLVMVVLAACGTRRNPDACCSNAVECEEIGFDEITPCLDLRVCVDGFCVAPTCTTSADCADPTPYCVNQLCAAACTADPDCTGVPGAPYCGADGTCVACTDSTQCTDPAAAVCDEVTHTCRPCSEDDQCASGVCLSVEGTCASSDEIVHVSTSGADAGDCNETNPCRTIPYGLTRITAERRVLRIADLDYAIPEGVLIEQDVYMDMLDTRLSRSSAGAIVTVSNQASVVLEGIRVQGAISVPVLTVTDHSDVTIVAATLSLEGFTESGAEGLLVEDQSTLRVSRSRLDGIGCTCQSSSFLEMADSQTGPRSVYLGAFLNGLYCARATIHHNRFEAAPALSMTRSTVTFENNVIAVPTVSAEGVAVFLGRSGTTVRFNTFAKPNQGGTAPALRCSGEAGIPTVSSNIFAWRTAVPVETTNCDVMHSLFDDAASDPPGANNVIDVPFEGIFADANLGDYRPGTTSPAREAAEDGLDVHDDIDHGPRPLPAGTTPDIGAYEVP